MFGFTDQAWAALAKKETAAYEKLASQKKAETRKVAFNLTNFLRN